MLTYSMSKAQYLIFTKNTSVPNAAQFDTVWNDSLRTICSIGGGKWPFLETEETVLTVANQPYVEIPNNIRKVISYRYTDGSDPQTDSTFLPRMVFDPLAWEKILAARLGFSNWPWFAYQRDTQLYFQPIPSTTGNTVTIRGRINIKNLTIADVTNVTVSDIVSGEKEMTVSGGMTQSFVGRWIQVAETTAANGGDGAWYEIAVVTDSTHITLKKPYQGVSIVAGTAASIIGQVGPIPEAYQMAPTYRSAALYWGINNPTNPNTALSRHYWMLYDGGVEAGIAKEYGGLIGQMMEESNESMEGAYVSPVFNSSDDLGMVPYWYPWQQASGFN